MDINPLSLLEVTMASDPVEEEDDDCIILDPPIETHIIEDTSDPPVPEPEPEIDASAGLHFLQSDVRLEDPLALERPSRNPAINKSIPFLWVSTNVNNLATATTAELEFRKSHYKDVHNVLEDRLHCTICQDHIGCDVRVHPKSIEHPVLKVLICEKCLTYYKNLQFTLNDKGKETRCRWCGKSPMGGGSTLQRCHQCPFSFCELCLHHNLPSVNYSHPTWTCCVCNMKQLWPARSLLWALQTLKNRVLNRPSNSKFGGEGDISLCCKNKVKRRSNNVPILPKQMVEKVPLKINGTPLIQPTLYKLKALRSDPSGEMMGKFRLVRVPIQPSKPPPAVINVPQKQAHRPPIPFSKEAPSVNVVDKPNRPPVANIGDKVDTRWLKNKIASYKADLAQLSTRLDEMNSTIPDFDTIKNMDLRMETISCFLSLSSGLLKECGNNLVNVWKECQARHMIDKIQRPVGSRLEREEIPPLVEGSVGESGVEMPVMNQQRETGIPSERPSESFNIFTSPLVSEPSNTTKKNKKKPRRLLDRRKPEYKNSHRLSPQLMKELFKKHNIKECFVSLERMQWPLQRSIDFR